MREIKAPAFLKKPLLYMVTGMAIMLLGAVLLFSGRGGETDAEKAFEQGERAMGQLRDVVLTLERVLKDERVAALAGLALEDSENGPELRQYLAGRISEFRDYRLLPPDVYLGSADELGDQAWILADMAMSARANGVAPLQTIPGGEDRVVASMVRIGGAESPAGYLMVTAGADALLESFDITLPRGGYIALEQNHGRFAPATLASYGDPGAIADGASKIPIAGSLFRIVVPRVRTATGASGIESLAIFLLGALLLAAGFIMRQRNLHPVARLRADPARAEPGEGAGREAPALRVVDAGEAPAPAGKADKEPPRSKLPLSDLGQKLEETPHARRPEESPVKLTAGIFRAYDIRGVVGETLDAGIARQVGQAVGTAAIEAGATPVVVGRDGRHSGPELVEGMIEGISSTGCGVVDIGAVPTGALYFAAHESGSGSGVMVTGSHNPPDYNGFKVMIGGGTLAGDEITALYERLQAGDIQAGEGRVEQREMLKAYRDRIASDIRLERPLKVVADCGNGIGGVCAAEILRAIGAEVLPMFDEVDGDFPNHHPDPSDPKNLEDLIQTVGLMSADLGVAFDGDADRLGVVTPSGEIIYADRMMMLFAREILGRNPGAKIIYDVKCTGKLDEVIREAGGEPEMYKTGHSLIKNRMREVGAPFAGEMSGHFFFKDRWYGFDCGIYSAARLLEILARDERNPEQVLGSLPRSISTPELKVHMGEGENHAFIASFQEKARFPDARVSTIDGLRADFEEGWGLVRASNTTPILVVRFEAGSEESLKIIQEAFRAQMLALNPDLELPF